MDEVVANGAATVIVGGEAGIGKTSLLDAFADQSTELRRVGVGRFRTQDVEPFAGLRAVQAALVGNDAAATLGDELSDVMRSVAATSETALAYRFRAFAALADALLQAVRDEPTLIVLDDVHWAIAPLHDFITFLVEEMDRRRRSHRLLLAVVTRVLPPPHPVAHLIDDLERRQRVWRLDLGALPAPTIAQIVNGAAGSDVSSSYHEVARRSARGNPLRAKAVVGLLRQRGVGTRPTAADQRTWRELRLPHAMDDPVVSWVASLDGAVRHALGVAAVVGNEVTLRDALVFEVPIAEIQIGLDIGLLQSDGVAVWFAHGLYREVLYDQLSALDRSDAHLRVGRHLASTAKHAEQHVVVARHVQAAGDAVPTHERVAALRAGGLAALELTLWSEAAQLLEASCAADPLTADATVLTSLGRAYYFDHDLESAATVLRRAVVAADAEGREDVWANALFLLLRMTLMSSTAAWRRPDDEELTRRFLSVATDPAGRALLLEVRAEAQIAAGRVEEGERAAREAIQLATASGRPEIQALAYYALAFADATAMRIHEGLEGNRRALAHARRSDDWYTRDTLATRLAYPLLATGELDEADVLASDCVARATATHEHSNLSLGLSTRAAVALLRGDLGAVDAFVQHAAEASRRANYAMTDLFVPGTAFLGHLYRGELHDAERVVEDWPNVPRSGRRAFRMVFEALGASRAASAGEQLRPPSGATQVAAGYFVAALDGALSAGQYRPTPDVCALIEQWHESGMEYAVSYPTSLTRIRAELSAASGVLDEADALFANGVERCETNGARVELARVLAGWARLAQAVDGDGSERARGLAARARDLAGRIGLDRSVLAIADIRGVAVDDTAAWRVILVTDIVGSTAVSNDLGDIAYLDLVLRHHAIVRRCLDRHCGHEFSEAGDGLLAWFATTAEAIAAAFDVQREVDLAGIAGPRLEVRVALAGGVPLFHAGRPYGLVLNRAARLVAAAPGGRIVVDEAVAAQLDAQMIEATNTVELRGIGAQRIGVVASGRRAYQRPGDRTLSG